MEEHLFSSETLDFKDLLKEHREKKESASAENIVLGGSKGAKLEKNVEEVTQEARKLLEENRGWVKEKLEPTREYLREVPDSLLEETFLESLKNSLVQYYRLARKVNPDDLSLLQESAFRRNIIRCCFADFVLALRAYQKQEIPPAKAVELAAKSHWLNPNTIVKLQEKYPETDPEIIIYGALNNTLDMPQFIERTNALMERLGEQYPDVRSGVIRRVAINNSNNPDEAISDLKDRIKDLKNEFPEIKQSIINYVALTHPLDYVEHTRDVGKIIPALHKSFSNIDIELITEVAFHYSNPQAFLEKAQKVIEQLKITYPGIPAKLINIAVIRHSTDPAQFIISQTSTAGQKKRDLVE